MRIPADLTSLAIRIPNELHIITRIQITTAPNKTQAKHSQNHQDRSSVSLLEFEQ